MKRIESLLKRLGLPTRLQFNREKVLEALRRDKKRQSENIHFVLLQSLGHAIVEKISIKELETVIEEMT
jgi:3-dehydroquinate synthase